MAYEITEKRGEQNVKQDDTLASKRFVIERKPDSVYFYELEEAVVLDVILDENHPEIKDSKLDPTDWPPNIDGSEPTGTDKNYSWIGRIRFRFLNSEINVEKEVLNWAFPMENTGIVEYPLMNEIVVVGKYMDQYFYTRKLNTNSTVNSNAMFSAERNSGLVERNLNIYDQSDDKKYVGPESKMNFGGGPEYTGILGSYFKFNPKIRMLKPFEGDTILQSRFGSSIRFGSYDSNRGNDNGLGEYSDHGGNPMILIRNRQAPVKNPQGFTGKGYTSEDINKDGSSIHFTSGKTISSFVPTTTTGMVNVTKGIPFPKLDGDQIVVNSDRIVFSSKANEMMFFSKKLISITTDQILSLNSYGNTTITSNKGILTLNAPKIYLNFNPDGPNDQPALLGRTTVLWMYALCDWMLLNVNSQIQTLTTLIAHFHLAPPPTKVTFPPAPPWIALMSENLQSLYASQTSLLALRSQLSSLMSSRVFLGG
jgi:hypothetical protein